jgi:hypothetical protein
VREIKTKNADTNKTWRNENPEENNEVMMKREATKVKIGENKICKKETIKEEKRSEDEEKEEHE